MRPRGGCSILRKVVLVFIFGVLVSLTLVKLEIETDDFASLKKKDGLRRVQKIVILPGPHKTGTTSVQTALSHWIASGHTSFRNWAWPVPTKQEFQSIHSGIQVQGGKGFAPLFTRLFASPHPSQDKLVQLYRHKLQEVWDQGKNIVIAAEHLDRLVRQANNSDSGASDKLSTDDMMNRLVDLLPHSSNVEARIIVGIQHRDPRVDHLISLWHQVGKTGESLPHFVTKSKRGLQDYSHNINSLGLADVFVKKGWDTVIINTGGAKQRHVDLATAVACHILKVDCQHHEHDHMTLFGADTNKTTKMLNQRSDSGNRNMNQATLGVIEDLLTRYDCQFREFRGCETVQLVFAQEMFRRCPTNKMESDSSLKRRSFPETIQAIIDMVCDQSPNILD